MESNPKLSRYLDNLPTSLLVCFELGKPVEKIDITNMSNHDLKATIEMQEKLNRTVEYWLD